MKSNRRQQGFSLIEMLVVIAIMLVLVAAFAPAVVASIQAGNEQATVNNLHQVVNAEIAYSRLYPSIGYSATAEMLGNGSGGGGAVCPSTPSPTGNGACLIPNAAAAQLDSNVLNGYIRDLIVQTDPSAWMKAHAGQNQIVIASESVKIKDEPCNDAWPDGRT